MSPKRKLSIGIAGCLLLLAGVAAIIWFSPYSPYQYGRYIPSDIDDAHRILLAELPADMMNEIKGMESEEGMINYHFGLGMYMRNHWGLWSGSRLSRYFNDIGIEHPDDMSGILLDTLWCRVHDKPLKLKERIQYYQDYWEDNEANE